jgi:type IX secretion system PorP/SprF family membrane protein
MLQKSFYTLLLALTSFGVFAQQDALFTQHMFNNLHMTPAFAGVDGVTRLSAFHRTQWLGYQSSFDQGGAPMTQIVTFNTPIYKLRSGFGAYVLNDRLGVQNNLEFQGMYAYHLGIKESKLSFGVKFGAYAQTINGQHYRYIDQDDPLIVSTEGKSSQVKPDLGLGLFYRAEKYYVGIGFNHLLRSQFDFGVEEARGELANHINFTGGYFYEVSFDLRLQLSVSGRTDLNSTQLDIGGIGYIKDTMWGGITVRQGEAAALLLGYSLLKDKSLKLGSAIDFIVSDRAAKENFSLEFMVSYELPVNPGSGKKVVRTPRYRH